MKYFSSFVIRYVYGVIHFFCLNIPLQMSQTYGEPPLPQTFSYIHTLLLPVNFYLAFL